MARETEIRLIEKHLSQFNYAKAYALLIKMINQLAQARNNEPESFLTAVEKLAARVRPKAETALLLEQSLQRLRGQFIVIDQNELDSFSEALFEFWQPEFSENELQNLFVGDTNFTKEGQLVVKTDFMMRWMMLSMYGHYYIDRQPATIETNKRGVNGDLMRGIYTLVDGKKTLVAKNNSPATIEAGLRRIIPHNHTLRAALREFFWQRFWFHLHKGAFSSLDIYNGCELDQNYREGEAESNPTNGLLMQQSDGSVVYTKSIKMARSSPSKFNIFDKATFDFQLRIKESDKHFLDTPRHRKFAHCAARYFGHIECTIEQNDYRIPDAESRDQYLNNFFPELTRKASLNMPLYLHERRAIEMIIVPYLYCDDSGKVHINLEMLERTSSELLFVMTYYNIKNAKLILSTESLFNKLSFKQLALLSANLAIKMMVIEKKLDFYDLLEASFSNGELSVSEILEIADLPIDFLKKLLGSILDKPEQLTKLKNLLLSIEPLSANKIKNLSNIFSDVNDSKSHELLIEIANEISTDENQKKDFISILARIPQLLNYFINKTSPLQYFLMSASDFADLILGLSNDIVTRLCFFENQNKNANYYHMWLTAPGELARIFQCSEVTPDSFKKLFEDDPKFRAALLLGIDRLGQDEMDQVFIYKFSELKPYLNEFRNYLKLSWFVKMLVDDAIPDMNFSYYILINLIIKDQLPELFLKSDEFLTKLLLEMLAYGNERNILCVFIKKMDPEQYARILPALVKNISFVETLLMDGEASLIQEAEKIPEFWITLLTSMKAELTVSQQENFVARIVNKILKRVVLLNYEEMIMAELIRSYLDQDDHLNFDALNEVSPEFLFVIAYFDQRYAKQILTNQVLSKKLTFGQLSLIYEKYPNEEAFHIGVNNENIYVKNKWGIILLHFTHKPQLTAQDLLYLQSMGGTIAKNVLSQNKFTSKEPWTILKLQYWHRLCIRIQNIKVNNSSQEKQQMLISNNFYEMLEMMLLNGKIAVNMLLQISDLPLDKLKRFYQLCLTRAIQFERLNKMILGIQPIDDTQAENISKIFLDSKNPDTIKFMDEIIKWMLFADLEQKRQFIQVLGKIPVLVNYIFKAEGYTQTAVYAVGIKSNPSLIFNTIQEVADLLLTLPSNYIQTRQFFAKRSTYSYLSGKLDYLSMWLENPKELARVFLDSPVTPLVLKDALTLDPVLRNALFQGIRLFGTTVEPQLSRKFKELEPFSSEFPLDSNLTNVLTSLHSSAQLSTMH